MVRIRFRRVGKKKQPSYRLVAADKESPRDGRFLEILGFYNPRTEPATIKLKEDRIFDWISKGAQPSDSARKVMEVAGTLERYERFKAGEDIEKLMQEAAAGEATRNISDKTRHDAPVGKQKAAPAAAEPKAETEAVEEAPAEEAKAEVETEAETKQEAPAEEPKAEEKAEETPAEEPKVEEEKETPAKKASVEEPKAKAEKAEEAPAEEAKVEKKKEAPPKETKAKADKESAPAITASRASVDKLDLPANITTALIEGDFKTIGKLAKQMEADTKPLLDVNGIGPKAIETIEEKLVAYTP